ncbi:hypothetical protein G4B88_029232 [Cannabis sativa]|uniref:Chalcone synthase n=1 Tax=Cannabis sativa TaxID=3483 RepID=A0A7J6DPB5_CANSA|nr:hypothetical protein G4B88_029232 [Cannabis sativa]
MEEIKGVLKAKDVGRCVATILAIGTANPLSCVNQDEFLHSYFKLTNNHNNTSFKELFTHICATDMPRTDDQLVKSLDLNRSIKRIMLYNLGCFAGGTVLRIAKDLVEKYHGASVLAVCAKVTSMDATFGRLSKDDKGRLMGHAIFGDGATALVIGNANDHENKGLFQIVSTSQTILADSEGCIEGHIREDGVTFTLSPRVPKLIGDNIEMCLVEVESRVGLEQEKLRASWHVLREYGNMSSASIFFILDEMRNKSFEEGRKTTGEGKNWGFLFCFGPGLTVETVVLHSIPI